MRHIVIEIVRKNIKKNEEQGDKETGEQGNRGTREQGNMGTGVRGNRGTGVRGRHGYGKEDRAEMKIGQRICSDRYMVIYHTQMSRER